MKRFLSLILVVLMVMGTMAVTVSADEADVTYTLSFVTANKKNFTNVIADPVEKGSKITLRLNGYEAGDDVKIFNNGVDVTASATLVPSKGLAYVVADSAENVFTAKINDVATTNSITVSTESYVTTNAINQNLLTYGEWKNIADYTFNGETVKQITDTDSDSYVYLGFPAGVTADHIEGSIEMYIPADKEFAMTYLLPGFIYYKAESGSANASGLLKLKSDGNMGFGTGGGVAYGADATVAHVDFTKGEWHKFTWRIDTVNLLDNTPVVDYYMDDILLASNIIDAYGEGGFSRMWRFTFGKINGALYRNPTIRSFSVVEPGVSFDKVSGDYVAGSKIAVITDSSEGLTLTTTVNGVAVADPTSITVASGLNVISAELTDAYGVVVDSADLTVYGTGTVAGSTSYMNKTFEGDANDTGTFNVGQYNGYKNNGQIVESTVGDNTFMTMRVFRNMGALPQGVTATTLSNDVNTAISSYTAVEGQSVICEFRYKYDSYWENKIGEDLSVAEYGTPVPIDSATALNYARRNHLYGTGATYRSMVEMGVNYGTGTKGLYPFCVDDYYSDKISTYIYKNGALTETKTDISVLGWHTYKIVANPTANTIHLYVDGELVDSGNLYSSAVTSISSFKLTPPRTSQSALTANTTVGGVAVCFDDIKITTADVIAAPSDAFIGETANQIVLASANLDNAAKVAKLAIIGVADDGFEIKTINATNLTDKYISFAFAKDIEKFFIWNWDSLKPLNEIIPVE